MICKNCGANVDSAAKFCTNCGKTIDKTEENSNVQKPVVNNTATQQVYQQPTKKKDNTLWIVLGVVGGVMLLTFIIIVGIFILAFSVIRDSYDYDYDDYEEEYEYGNVVEEFEDPTGHTISIIDDEINYYTVDTEYLRDLQDTLIEKAKVASPSSIDKLKATKKTIELLNDEYIDYSRSEIVTKLKNENYDDATIQYALDHCGANWEERAVIDGLTFMVAGGISKTELIDFLKDDGYSEEIATKAANNEHFDYYEQAVYEACLYRYAEQYYGDGYTKEEAEEALKKKGYTDKEVLFAIKTVYEKMPEY